MDMKKGYEEVLRVTKVYGQTLPNGHGSPAQVQHNAFQQNRPWNKRCSTLICEADYISLLECPGKHIFVYFWMKVKNLF